MVHYTIKHSLARTISFKYKNLKKKKQEIEKQWKKKKNTWQMNILILFFIMRHFLFTLNSLITK